MFRVVLPSDPAKTAHDLAARLRAGIRILAYRRSLDPEGVQYLMYDRVGRIAAATTEPGLLAASVSTLGVAHEVIRLRSILLPHLAEGAVARSLAGRRTRARDRGRLRRGRQVPGRARRGRLGTGLARGCRADHDQGCRRPARGFLRGERILRMSDIDLFGIYVSPFALDLAMAGPLFAPLKLGLDRIAI